MDSGSDLSRCELPGAGRRVPPVEVSHSGPQDTSAGSPEGRLHVDPVVRFPAVRASRPRTGVNQHPAPLRPHPAQQLPPHSG
jgi:hypothetical protein